MDDTDLPNQLRELTRRLTEGSITNEEFASAKERLLGRPGPTVSGTPATPAASGPTWPIGTPWANRHSPAHAGAWQEDRRPPVISLVGSCLALLAFVALPLTAVPALGSITGAVAASEAGRDNGALLLLWLIPLSSVIAGSLAAWLWRGASVAPAARRKASVTIIVLAVAVVGVYLFGLIRLQMAINELGELGRGLNVIGFAGAGFWLVIAGMALAAIGGCVEFTRSDPAR
ncbi:SHOCT domain-containing protein [Streptosporangiaceae bacterium NEAU-GS5]|nr:SHOCT domain-containing protein [Streptosporangiaceae bacterium NEAU-GS5]